MNPDDIWAMLDSNVMTTAQKPRSIGVSSSEYRDRRLNFWRAQDTCTDPDHFANMDLSAANGLLLQAGLAWAPEALANLPCALAADLRSPEPPAGFVEEVNGWHDDSDYPAIKGWAWLRRRAGLEAG